MDVDAAHDYLTALNTLYGVLALFVFKWYIEAGHVPGVVALRRR